MSFFYFARRCKKVQKSGSIGEYFVGPKKVTGSIRHPLPLLLESWRRADFSVATRVHLAVR